MSRIGGVESSLQGVGQRLDRMEVKLDVIVDSQITARLQGATNQAISGERWKTFTVAISAVVSVIVMGAEYLIRWLVK